MHLNNYFLAHSQTDLYEAKKRGNIALAKVENIHHDPKYKLEKQ